MKDKKQTLKNLKKIKRREDGPIKNKTAKSINLKNIPAYVLQKITDNAMTIEDWKKLRYFTIREAFGSPFLMNRDLMFMLDDYRDHLGKLNGNTSFIIHCGFSTKGHSTSSQHYVGRAVDGHVSDMILLDAFVAAVKFGFTGIGLYPCWSPHGGLHLDNRILEPHEERKIWWRDKKGAYHNVETIATLMNINKINMQSY